MLNTRANRVHSQRRPVRLLIPREVGTGMMTRVMVHTPNRLVLSTDAFTLDEAGTWLMQVLMMLHDTPSGRETMENSGIRVQVMEIP
jgi:hypothetical protein